MSQESGYLNYADSVKLIHETMKSNSSMLNTIIDFFKDYSQSMDKITEKFAELPNVFQNRSPGVIENAPNSEPVPKITSSFSDLWHRLAGDVIGAGQCLQPFINSLREEIIERLSDLYEEYNHRSQVLSKQGRAILCSVQRAEESYDVSYKAYELAAAKAEEACSKKSTHMADLQAAFIKAQDAALAANQELNDRKSKASTEMGNIISDFETLEFWRTETLKRCLVTFSKSLEDIADRIDKQATSMSSELSRFDPSTDAKKLHLQDELKNVASDDRFQFIPICASATRVIDLSMAYQEELENGGRLMMARESFIGSRDELNLEKGEIIVTVGGSADHVLCKNINESVGLVPARLLQEVSNADR